MFRLLSFLILPVILFQSAYGVNILFLFGGANYSHKMSIWPLVMALSDQGHNVTFISSSPKQPKPSPKVLDITPAFMSKVTEKIYKVDRIQDRKDGIERIFSNYEESALSLCQNMMNSQDDPAFNEIIENGKFDLIVVNIVYGDCAFFVAHHLGAKYIIFDSSFVFTWMYGRFGLQLDSSWIPDLVSKVHYPMTFWDRVKVHYYSYKHYDHSQNFESRLQEIYKSRFGLTEAPTLSEIQRNASLVLVNCHYSLDFARSIPPLFVEVGGMQIWEPEGVLPAHFKKFMDSYEDGVILISFGSTIEFNSISEEYLNMFFNMMNKFDKVGFIWRWDGPLHPNNPKNLLSEKWLPQKEILREKSIRALMSHGGINSMLEATSNGVPIISMPLFADQDFQAYRVQAYELGVRIEVATLTQRELDGAVWEILNNSKYKKNMMARSALFKDRPNAVETAVKAIEFVLRHDDLSPLKPIDLDQSFWVREHVDVYFFVFAVLTAINILIPATLIWLCRKCFF